jgi:D-sedoheptulose 7-phosphate isomerase
LEKTLMEKDVAKRIAAAIGTHKKMVAAFEADGIETIVAAAEMITSALKGCGRVFICGNGGSAADAQHIAAELVGRFECDRPGLAAVALTTNTSIITSVANDYSYENVFTRQVEALVNEGDILWAISTSGSSSNVVSAAGLAKKKGAGVLAFTGRSDSKLERIADICFCAEDKSTARSQEIHQLAYHIICALVERSFAGS